MAHLATLYLASSGGYEVIALGSRRPTSCAVFQSVEVDGMGAETVTESKEEVCRMMSDSCSLSLAGRGEILCKRP